MTVSTALLILFVCNSCITAAIIQMVLNKPRLTNDNILSPSEGVLVYGSLKVKQGWTYYPAELSYAQLDPAYYPSQPHSLSPGGGYWFLEPLPMGGSYKLFAYSYVYDAETKTGTIIRGMQGIEPLDFQLSDVPPGLYYVGAYFSDNKGNLKENKRMKESTVLKGIQPAFKGTIWEPVIQRRIQELKNAQK